MSDGLPRAKDTLTRRILEFFDEDTSWVEIGNNVDVTFLKSEDPCADWHPATNDFNAMFKAVLWAEVEDESHYGLEHRLEENPDIAEAFGFDLDDIPTGETFKNAYRDRFETFHTKFEILTENLNALARQHGNPLGSWDDITAGDRDGMSERTIQRLLRAHTHRVMREELPNLVYPYLKLPRPDNAIYDEEALKRVLTVMSLNRSAANDGGKKAGDHAFYQEYAKDEYGDIDLEEYLNEPFYVDGPTGETVLESIKELDREDIIDMVNGACETIYYRMEPYAEFNTPVELAIDITYMAYWGETDKLEWIMGAPEDKEYDWCFQFATASIIGENIHTVIAMKPIGSAEARADNDYPTDDSDKSWRAGEVVRDLLDIAQEYARIGTVYADRGLFSVDTINAFEEAGVFYMMPVPLNDRLKRWLRRNVEDGIIAVEKEHNFFGEVAGSDQYSEYVSTTLIGVPNDPDAEQYPWENIDEDSIPVTDDDADAVPFITNKPVKDEIAVDRRRALKEVRKYSQRGAIETSYRKIKSLVPQTTSKNFIVRLFHFGFGVLMYNTWLLVDFLVQRDLPVPFRYKPRISSNRFKQYVNRYFGTLIY